MSANPPKTYLTQSELKQYAMTLLARREYGANELRQKLARKGSAEDADAVLCWLQENNLQSDDRFAQMLLRSKSLRGYGPLRIRQEMKQKRLDNQAVLQAFEGFEGDWFEQALQTYQKKYSKPLGKEPKERAKRQRFMSYRGYTGEQICYAIEQGHKECTHF
ncbi:MAG: hypothetical protein CSA49_00555 [Gammaproteobacteria bacterium]|nr:MAG: hypothetical protein CSA49_00555 [Gammaproteobacteria bacterium]